jgi:hypothetical protein
MNPDRIIIGSNSDRAIALMKKVYEPFTAPILVTDVKSAELIKHAANSFLALKISHINAISTICETSGADVEKVAEAEFGVISCPGGATGFIEAQGFNRFQPWPLYTNWKTANTLKSAAYGTNGNRLEDYPTLRRRVAAVGPRRWF